MGDITGDGAYWTDCTPKFLQQKIYEVSYSDPDKMEVFILATSIFDALRKIEMDSRGDGVCEISERFQDVIV